jgi:acyl-coenzyme A synthetase/AMP-(fatty) acid ligase
VTEVPLPDAAGIPLLSHAGPDDVVAWRGSEAVSRQRFLGHVARVAAGLPPGRHFVNACADRYRFAVGFAAGLLSGRVSLLPSTLGEAVLRQLAEFAPDVFVLGDGEALPGGLPAHPFDDALPPAGAALIEPPVIAADQLVAWVFTSGSTGVPVPHRKTWGKLVRDVRIEARQVGLQPGFSLLGTVPPQHMYGLESTVLMALQGGGAVHAGRPFYPADVFAALAALARPRVLVTTPFHLRNLLSAGLPVPPADLLLCATAPLGADLAAQAEAAFDAPLMEIYGSTETGQIATRRTCGGEEWQLFDGVRLDWRDDRCWASGGHVELPVALADVLEPAGEGRFRLGGRDADLVNIAGKRSSLGYLNRQLLALPGVVDGAFFMPDEDAAAAAGITRLTAFVVAPGLTAGELMAGLRKHVDAVFLPRPLVMLDALPRNATGKLTREACRALLAARGSAKPESAA